MSVDMDYIALDSILDECLERMSRGEALEACLASYPDQEEELRSLLIVAQDVSQLEPPKTNPQAIEAGRQRMFTALNNKKMLSSKDIQTLPVSIVGIVRYLEQVRATIKINFSKEFLVMHKTVIAIVLVLVVLFGGSAASAYAAQGSLPGDVLYPMKTAIEDASVDFSMDSASEVRLYLRLVEKRIAEMESLAAEGRYEDLAVAVERFEFHIEQALQSLLIVAQGNPAEAETLASTLGDLMERHTQILLVLMADAPDNVRATFEDAVEASQGAISTATEFGVPGAVANENGSQEGGSAENANELGAGDDGDNSNLNGGNDETEDDNENFNGNQDDDNLNADDDDDGNTNGDDDQADNVNSDDDENTNGDDHDDDENTNGDDDDEAENTNSDDDDEDESANGGDDDEDENTNGDDDDDDEKNIGDNDEDNNTNSGDDEEDSSNDHDSEDESENVNGDNDDDDMNENGDDSDDDSSSNLNDNSSDDEQSDESEDNSNGSSDDDSDSHNDNSGEEEGSSDGSSNENSTNDDDSDDDSHEDDSSDENDNEDSEVDEESETDNSDINDNSNG